MMHHSGTQSTEESAEATTELLSVWSLCSLCLCGAFLISSARAQPAPPAAPLRWLNGSPPATTQGVSWGVPWPRGRVAKGATFRLMDDKGSAIPVQSWPMAYWPDGSVKWTGHAAAAGSELVGPLSIALGEAAAPAQPLKVQESA